MVFYFLTLWSSVCWKKSFFPSVRAELPLLQRRNSCECLFVVHPIRIKHCIRVNIHRWAPNFPKKPCIEKSFWFFNETKTKIEWRMIEFSPNYWMLTKLHGMLWENPSKIHFFLFTYNTLYMCHRWTWEKDHLHQIESSKSKNSLHHYIP